MNKTATNKTATAQGSEDRFNFGDNWRAYADTLNDAKINEAVRNLQHLLGEQRIERKSFLDIGCGSGVHTLAAIKMGASSITAFDFDPQSVATTRDVLQQYAPDFPATVKQRSILDTDFNQTYDIVYSWGVLHHTGDMWQAIENAAAMVAPNGQFIIALYKKTPACGFWTAEKRFYTRLPALLRFPITALYALLTLIGVTLTGTNPVRYVRDHKTFRGMNFWHNMVDWVGGYPYESASPEDTEAFMDKLGFTLESSQNTRPVRGFGIMGSGCAEYVFTRTQ